MNSQTVQQQQTDFFSKRLLFFHRVVAIVFTLILFTSILVIQSPWNEPNYNMEIKTGQLITSKLQSQFDKVFVYLGFVDRITKTTFLMKNSPKQISITFPSSLNISQPTYRCKNSSTSCKINNASLNLQEQYIMESLQKTLSPLMSMMQCLKGQCFKVNGLGILSNFLWQYRLDDFIIMDRIYIATKLSNQTEWNLAVFPIVGDQLNQKVLDFDITQTTWSIFNNSRQGKTHLYLAKIREMQTVFENIKYQYKIIAHLSSQIFEKDIDQFAGQFFDQTLETNFRIKEQPFEWFKYHYRDNIRFPANPADPLITILHQVYQPENAQQPVISFSISRYQTEFLQAKTAEPNFSVYFDFLPMFLILLIFRFERQHVQNYILANFSKMANILNLYKYNINEIFSQRKSKSTLVIQSGQIFDFYEKLSQMPGQNLGFTHNNHSKMLSSKNRQQKKQLFKFDWILKKIALKFKDFCRPILQEKNKEIMNNKFAINSSVNQICQNEAKNLKQYFLRAKDLGLIQPFFNFAYLSLLKTPVIFDQILAQDVSPLPTQIVNLFRKINRTVRSDDIKNAFRFHSIQPSLKKLNSRKTLKKLKFKSQAASTKTQHQLFKKKIDQETIQEGTGVKHTKGRISGLVQLKRIFDSTEEELQIRVQCNLLLKFLTILKDLDIHNENAKILNLEKQIISLDESIENLRYLIGKHNKNIRMYYK